MTDSVGSISEEGNPYDSYSDFTERKEDESNGTVPHIDSTSCEELKELSGVKRMELSMALHHGISKRVMGAPKGVFVTLSPDQKKQIAIGVTAIANKEASIGLSGLHGALQSWLKSHPYPPSQPYPPWKTYATNLQAYVGAERSTFQDACGKAVSNGINTFISAHPELGTPQEIWDYLNNEMTPNFSKIYGGQFDAYTTQVQNSLINPIWSGNPGVLPPPPAPPSPPDMKPVSESMLKINGVSYVLFSDPKASSDPSKAMAFPISHTSDSGGAAVPSATSTEAIWYTLENAYNVGDKQLFQQTLNGYLYLVQQKAATVSGTDWASTPGLAGWIIDLGIPPGATFTSGKFPYPQGNPGSANLSTATDGDEQIINLMLKSIGKFGDLNLHSFGSFPGSASPEDMKMSDLTRVAVETFLYNNIAGHPASNYDKAHHGFKYQGVLYNPVLSNDNWGGGGWTNDPNQLNQGTFLNPSYFDPYILANIYAYVSVSSDPKISSQAGPFKTAMINSVNYLKVLQSEFQDKSDPSIAGMPDNPAWNENDGPDGNGPHPVGWDSIRFLTNVGKYVDYCDNKGGKDPFGILSDIREMGTKMLGFVIKNSTAPYTPDMTLGDTPKGANLKGGALLGPLLVAMKALTPKDPQIPTVKASLMKASQVDMAQMDPKNASAYSYWQSIYYGSELALVNAFDADTI